MNYFDGQIRAIVGIAGQLGNFVGDFLAFDDFAENRMLVVQPRCGGNREEKLAAVGAGSGVGHGELAGLVVLQRRMKFVGESIAGATSAVATRAAALNHEIGDDAVEG